MRKSASILHETVFAIAKAEQGTTAKEQEHLVLPDELPEEAAEAHLVLGGEFLAGVDRVFEVGQSTVANGLLPHLMAKIKESSTRGCVVLLYDDLDEVLQSLVVVKDVDWVCVVIHSCHVFG